MSSDKGTKANMIAKALGASEVIGIKGSRPKGPLGWLEYTQTLQHRLISRGGRPSNPHWDTKRLVPFRRQTWKHLTNEAEAISKQGRKIGPAQLVAMIIEDSVASAEGFIFNKQAQFQVFNIAIQVSSEVNSKESITNNGITYAQPSFFNNYKTVPVPLLASEIKGGEGFYINGSLTRR